MSLRRVFVDSISEGVAYSRGNSARHLASAVRLRLGERLEVSDQIRAYLAVTESCSPDEVRFRIEEPLPDPGPAPCLDVALAIIRFPRFEWAVEKLTELGVRSIIPVIATRSDAKLVSSAPGRAARWRAHRVRGSAAIAASRRAGCRAADPFRTGGPRLPGRNRPAGSSGRDRPSRMLVAERLCSWSVPREAGPMRRPA